MDETKAPGIKVAQVFLSRFEFSHADNAINLPANTPMPESEVQVKIQHGTDETRTKGLVGITVSSLPTPNYLYKFSGELVALFEVDKDNPNMPLESFLKVNGAAFLFPFVREAVATITLKGRFGPTWIQPTNVASMFHSEEAG